MPVSTTTVQGRANEATTTAAGKKAVYNESKVLAYIYTLGFPLNNTAGG